MQSDSARFGARLAPLARALAALALTGLLAGAGAAVFGYAALRTLQDVLGIPDITPTIGSVVGAILGCRLAFRWVPAGWYAGEGPGSFGCGPKRDTV